MIPDTLKALVVPIGTLRPYARNPRNGDTEAIRASLRANGQYRPLVVNQRTSEILAGNHTYSAALEEGWSEIAVTYVDADDDQAARIVLVDNRTNDLARYDEGLLARLLEEQPALEGTGYAQADLDELLARVNAASGTILGDPDAVPDVPETPQTKRGDLYQLGAHRLLCGDSTVLSEVERLMDAKLADMVWTDPPYGVTYQANESLKSLAARNRRQDGLTVENDSLTEGQLGDLLAGALANAWAVCDEGRAWYVTAPAGPLFQVFGAVLKDLGVWRQTIMWLKQQFVFGRTDYHYRHEPIFYGWKEGAAHYFIDDRTQDSVWEIDRPSRSPEHPTMKPVELVARALRNSSLPGAIVLDVFGGSGTTMAAAEQEGRVAYLMEIDPRYCDVIVARYEQLTGKTAQRL